MKKKIDIEKWVTSARKNNRKRKIVDIVIQELSQWKSTTKVSGEEIIRFIDRLYKLKP